MSTCKITIDHIDNTDPSKLMINVEQGTLRIGSILMLGRLQVGYVGDIMLAYTSIEALTAGYTAMITLASDLRIGEDVPMDAVFTA